MDNPALRARFDGYDRDEDGSIGESEFGQLLNAMGAGYTDTQVRAAFEALDSDGNGRIDFSEFSAWWTTS